MISKELLGIATRKEKNGIALRMMVKTIIGGNIRTTTRRCVGKGDRNENISYRGKWVSRYRYYFQVT